MQGLTKTFLWIYSLDVGATRLSLLEELRASDAHTAGRRNFLRVHIGMDVVLTKLSCFLFRALEETDWMR